MLKYSFAPDCYLSLTHVYDDIQQTHVFIFALFPPPVCIYDRPFYPFEAMMIPGC